MKNEQMLKLIIVGDCGVGKTNILMRFCENTFKLNYVSTIGVDFKIKTIQQDGKCIKLQIWDTAGQERYRNIAQTYYKGAAGIILVYSVTDARSFENIEKWVKQIHMHAAEDVALVLVANKKDVCEEDRQVQMLEGKTLGDRFEIPFLEVSAKSGDTVADIFQVLTRNILHNCPNGIQGVDGSLSLSRELERQKTQRKKKQQCQC